MGANVLNGRIDTILLSVFRGPTAIAFYTLAKQIADFLVAPAHSLGFGISPTFGEQKANDSEQQAARLYERSLIYTITLYGPAAAGVVLVASPTIKLIFGTDYAGSIPVLQIFSLFVVVRALDRRRRPAHEAALLYEETAASAAAREREREGRRARRAAVVFDRQRPDRRERRASIRFRRRQGGED
jgi:hypothetical protein